MGTPKTSRMFAPTYFAAQRLSLRVHRASRARSLARKIARQAVANKAAADAMHEAAAEDQRYLSVLYAKLMAGHRVYHRNGKVTLEVRSRDFKVKCQIIADPSKPYFTFILTEERKRQKAMIIKVTELTALRVLRFVEEFSGKK